MMITIGQDKEIGNAFIIAGFGCFGLAVILSIIFFFFGALKNNERIGNIKSEDFLTERHVIINNNNLTLLINENDEDERKEVTFEIKQIKEDNNFYAIYKSDRVCYKKIENIKVEM